MTHFLSSAHVVHLVEQLREELITLRRYFHQYPELSWEEEHTAQTIAEYLISLGLNVQTDVGGHGLVAHLIGELPGPVIAYRTDMDALPLQDMLEAPYRSVNLGIKHACGHDVHMTIALGVAKVVSRLRNQLRGTLRFIFQPAEEALDGAQAMIANSALENPTPDAIVAVHAFPLPVGTFGLTRGCCLAGMEEYRVKFSTPDTSLPALIKQTLPALSALSNQAPPATPQAFESLIARMMTGDDLENSVYLSCWQDAGVFTDNAHIACLASLTDYAARHDLQRRIRQTLDTVVTDTATSYTFWTSFANPPTINNTALIEQLHPYVEEVAGKENVMIFYAPYPFAHEDFALYAQRVPAALLWLGTANRDLGIQSILHTANYDVDEDAVVSGTAVMTYVLLKLSQSLP